MEQIDVKCKFHKFSDADSFSIAGDLRVAGVYVTHAPGTVATQCLPYPIEFKSGSASGSVLLTTYLIRPIWFNPEPFVNIPGDGVRFPDGLYVASPQQGGNNVIESMTLIYQGLG
jgi:hypothetical protein